VLGTFPIIENISRIVIYSVDFLKGYIDLIYYFKIAYLTLAVLVWPAQFVNYNRTRNGMTYFAMLIWAVNQARLVFELFLLILLFSVSIHVAHNYASQYHPNMLVDLLHLVSSILNFSSIRHFVEHEIRENLPPLNNYRQQRKTKTSHKRIFLFLNT
jgi:hypothetical protein